MNGTIGHQAVLFGGELGGALCLLRVDVTYWCVYSQLGSGRLA